MNQALPFLNTIFVFILGLEFGSFANVCIYRWPRNASVLHPHRSFCPWCENSIAWYDNIPVLSFLILRGRCRACRSPISFRYPIVELSMGLLWMLAYRTFALNGPGVSPAFILAVFVFLFSAVVTTATDLDWRLIPDESSALLAVVGVATAFANPYLGAGIFDRVQASLLGLIVGAGVIWAIGFVGESLFGKEAMGGGDVKLLGAMGTVIGWQGALFTLFLAAAVGGLVAIVGLSTGRLKRRSYIPFGPFLNFSGCMTLLIIHRTGKMLDLLA